MKTEPEKRKRHFCLLAGNAVSFFGFVKKMVEVEKNYYFLTVEFQSFLPVSPLLFK